MRDNTMRDNTMRDNTMRLVQNVRRHPGEIFNHAILTGAHTTYSLWLSLV